MVVRRYLLTIPGRSGSHAPQRRIVVYAMSVRGPGGHAVYADASGRLRVEITEDGVVLPESSGVRALALSEPHP